MAIIKEDRIVGGKPFNYTYSDEGYYIEREGELYEDALDPAEEGREYTETDIKINEDEEDKEDE